LPACVLRLPLPPPRPPRGVLCASARASAGEAADKLAGLLQACTPLAHTSFAPPPSLLGGGALMALPMLPLTPREVEARTLAVKRKELILELLDLLEHGLLVC
jgi:hypothetical protein